MKAYLTLCFLCCWLFSCEQKPAYNIDAEELNPTTKMPKDWGGSLTSKEYNVKLDTFGEYIKPLKTPFVKFTVGEFSQPGRFTYSEPVSNGAVKSTDYRGKVVVIVNSTSQSQAEYTTMAFQSSPNVKVIGSTTAGADGNVSRILLPGGISTMISGIGVFYPDGTPTQRVGVKVDHFLKPTIKGTIEGRDELLEKAKEILKNSPK